MEASFWQQRWEDNDIAFHKNEANPLLIKYFNQLSLVNGSRVFLPLCGKTLDIPWLLSNGYRVAGAELSKIAVETLFMKLEMKPKISRVSEVDHYSAQNIDIFVGDIFHLSSKILGLVDAIYDRAALVALPEKIRNQYTAHLIKITNKAL
jgi:thiopurine S-methyltransferase